MQKGRFKAIAGFTLVELMVVVGIIGVLAAVAIPQFKSYQAKAKQSEAKLALSGIYMAEEAYKVEYDYASCLVAMGVQAPAKSYYRIGFGTAATTTAVPTACVQANMSHPNTTGPAIAALAAISTGANFPATGFMNHLNTAESVGGTAVATASSNGFIAQAEGSVGGAVNDIWVINHQKAIVNYQSGI